MSQNPLVLPTTGTLSGLAAVTAINAALDSLNTHNSGASAPTTTEAFMLWMDTTNGLWKQRNAANTAWVVVGQLGVANLGLASAGANNDITSLQALTANLTFKNRITNGLFRVDQVNAGASVSVIAGSAVAYVLDGWYASCTGANISTQQVAGSAPYSSALKLTGLVGNTGTLFGARIESAHSYDMINQQVSTQVQLSSSSITSVTWKAYYANSSNVFGTQTQIATGTLTINSTPTVYSFSFNAGANAGNGIAIEFSTGALVASQTITYGGVQVEKSPVATAMEYPDIETDVQRCQRYVAPWAALFSGNTTSGNGYAALFDLPVLMRTTPSYSSPTLTGLNGIFAIASTNAIGNGTIAGYVSCSCTSTTPGGAYYVQGFAFARL